jgi:hypothetical protein
MCIKDYHFTTLALAPFGLGFFAKLYPDKNGLYHIWATAMKNAFVGIKYCHIRLMGFNQSIKNVVVEIMGQEWFNDALGYFPGCVADVTNVKTTLFINGWDMLSGPGNGCEGDASLDGAMGANTTIAVTGNGALNPLLLRPDHVISIL